MATTNPTPADCGEDNFALELRRVREQIKQKFTELIDSVKVRESELLTELDFILATYYQYRNEIDKINTEKRDLEAMQTSMKQDIISSSIKNFQEIYLIEIAKKLKSTHFPTEPKMVHFVCDYNRIFAELNKLGELVEKVRSGVDYKSKVYPVVSVCEKGKGMEQLNDPCGVTVDNKTGNIYVADQWNHCVKVFDNSGNILFKFGDSDVKGKMEFPKCLLISGNRILISNGEFFGPTNHKILVYELNGNFVSKIGKYGKGKIEFNCPCGLACNESNGDIYICDCGNNRIQILSKDFKFKSQFGAGKLKYPRDVKLSKEYISFLDASNPCLHLYSYNLVLQKSVISSGKGMQVVSPRCFFIDNSNNFLISDCSSNSILIFNPEFELIHKINTSTHPKGVVVDNQGRVIVACQADRDCLQIF